MVRAWPCMANTYCNWCQKKEDKLNFVTMQTFSDKSLVFRKINLIYGFLFFSGTHCIASVSAQQRQGGMKNNVKPLSGGFTCVTDLSTITRNSRDLYQKANIICLMKDQK